MGTLFQKRENNTITERGGRTARHSVFEGYSRVFGRNKGREREGITVKKGKRVLYVRTFFS